MDYTIQLGTSLNPKEILVSKDAVVRDLLMDNNIPFQDGQVTLNGRNLGTTEINMTIEELGVKDDDYILATSKHDGGLALRI